MFNTTKIMKLQTKLLVNVTSVSKN